MKRTIGLISIYLFYKNLSPFLDGKRLFGGKMTEERFHKVETVTGDTIKTMHKYVAICIAHTSIKF